MRPDRAATLVRPSVVCVFPVFAGPCEGGPGDIAAGAAAVVAGRTVPVGARLFETVNGAPARDEAQAAGTGVLVLDCGIPGWAAEPGFWEWIVPGSEVELEFTEPFPIRLFKVSLALW